MMGCGTRTICRVPEGQSLLGLPSSGSRAAPLRASSAGSSDSIPAAIRASARGEAPAIEARGRVRKKDPRVIDDHILEGDRRRSVEEVMAEPVPPRMIAGISDTRTRTGAAAGPATRERRPRPGASPSELQRREHASASGPRKAPPEDGGGTVDALLLEMGGIDAPLSEVARLQPGLRHYPEAPHRLEARSAATGRADRRQRSKRFSRRRGRTARLRR